jgi:alkyl hydroperoxide reductase subunit AhpC
LLEQFEGEDVSVVGVSTDSYFSHNAWFSDRDIFPVEISHPVVADTTHALSKTFGVLNDDMGVSYRGTIIVDDKGTVRSTSVTDLSAGRSPQEVLRTVQALKSGGLCGVNWNSGDDFVA